MEVAALNPNGRREGHSEEARTSKEISIVISLSHVNTGDDTAASVSSPLGGGPTAGGRDGAAAGLESYYHTAAQP